MLAAMPAKGQELQVLVTGIAGDDGALACSLHRDPEGFPAAGWIAADRVAPRDGQGLCVFRDLVPGRYAVAVLHDANDNGRLDLNVLGIPTEDWAVSGGRAPSLRAPRFDEAAFSLGPGPQRLQIPLSR